MPSVASPYNGPLSLRSGSSSSSILNQRKSGLNALELKHSPAPAAQPYLSDTNNGDDDNPNYRSRLVAREIRRRGENPIFAPTPPLESLRIVISLAATDVPGRRPHCRDPTSEDRTQISFINICRAYFCAETNPNDPTYVELPSEDPDHGSMVGLLLKTDGTASMQDAWRSSGSKSETRPRACSGTQSVL